ncbi:MAG: transporter substrate-binding protein [Betaproteobacteria bacterium]|nr:transporter substrate-binding protein [Betaproteobacteria bacterium]
MNNEKTGMRERFAMALVAAALLYLPSAANAQDYPNRPVRLLLPFSAGGGSDIIARVLAQKLSAQLGQSVVVDNRAGASGNIAAELTARANADGYTLIFGNSSLALAPVVFSKLSYDPIKDLQPISMVSSFPFVLGVHPSMPARDVRELVALAKSKPGELAYASAGVGTLGNFAMQLFRLKADIKLNHISYKGSGPAILSVIAGETQLATLTLAAVNAHIASGKVRALAVLDKVRALAIPQVPTMKEAGIDGVVVLQWNGLLSTAGTPRATIERLHRETVKALADPELRQRLANEGAAPVGDTPAQFGDFIKQEMRTWNEVAKKASIGAEQ